MSPAPQMTFLGMERCKVCLVTVGATAPFNSLVREVLTGPFLAQLRKYNYTHLMIQWGEEGGQMLQKFLLEYPPHHEIRKGIKIAGFGFTHDMGQYLRMAMSDFAMDQERGMLICHAGTGSILDGLRGGLPIMVVPNPDLADNHQQELADQLDKLGYVTKTSIGNVAAAVDDVEALRRTRPSRMRSDIGLKEAMRSQIPLNVD